MIPCILILLSVLLMGCQTSGLTRDDLHEYSPDAEIADGLTVGEAVEMDQQRHRQAIEVFAILRATETFMVTPSVSPLKHPTVVVKYVGKPVKGIFDDVESIQKYRKSMIDGNTVIYYSDLSAMTLALERMVNGEPYEYREISSTVPYGYCLDFIEENLGKETKEPEGFIIRKIECNQDDLGLEM